MATEIKGSAELKRKLDSLGTVARGQTLRRALVAGALPIQNEAKRRVPRLTSNLARSIHIGGETEDSGVVQRTGQPVPGPEINDTSAAVYVGTDVEYARRIEFGFNDVDSRGRNYHQPAQPYMRPAVDTTKGQVQREVSAALSELIKAAAQ